MEVEEEAEGEEEREEEAEEEAEGEEEKKAEKEEAREPAEEEEAAKEEEGSLEPNQRKSGLWLKSLWPRSGCAINPAQLKSSGRSCIRIGDLSFEWKSYNQGKIPTLTDRL